MNWVPDQVRDDNFMKIIQAHKYYWHRDGASNYVLDWSQVLQERGHLVAPFTMQGQENIPSPWSKFFISETNLQKPKLSPFYLAKAASRFFYSFEAQKKFNALCEVFKPDLLHVHNLYHHLSVAPLKVAAARKLPVVMTIHDYALLSSNYSLLPEKRVWSQAGFLFERWLGVYKKTVRYFIAPTQFVKNLFVERGFPAERVRVVPYFVPLREGPSLPYKPSSPYFFYAGRLVKEKGVQVLLRALSFLPETFHLKIAGAGPFEKELQRLVVELRLSGRVEFLGQQTPAAMRTLMANSLAVCVPSLWYEVFCLVALEAMSEGVPVLASKIGGLPEVVGHGGWLLPAGDAEAWAAQMKYIVEHAAECDEVGRRAAVRASEFTVERHYRSMMDIYQRAVLS